MDEFKHNCEAGEYVYTCPSDVYRIPDGLYIVAITNMQVGKTKGGKDALKVEFTISDGPYIHCRLYYTQVIYRDSGFTKRKVMNFLTSIGYGGVLPFFTLEGLKREIPRIFDEIKNSCEYDLLYKENGESFPIFTITGIYDLE